MTKIWADRLLSYIRTGEATAAEYEAITGEAYSA